MASQPKEQHCYLVHNFAEFEALARRALHEGTKRLRVTSWAFMSSQNDAYLVLQPALFDRRQYVQSEACYPGEIEPT